MKVFYSIKEIEQAWRFAKEFEKDVAKVEGGQGVENFSENVQAFKNLIKPLKALLQMDKDSLYEQRKQEKLEEAMKEVAEKKKAQMELVSSSVDENTPVEAVSVTDVTVDPSSVPSVSVSDITSPQPEEVSATEVSPSEDYH